MAAVATHLADTSALARLHRPAVAGVLGPLIEAGLVGTGGVIEFELGWATRSGGEFDWSEPTGQKATNGWPRTMRTGTARLTCKPCCGRSGRIRAVGFPDLLIAAVAEREQVTLLHYDGDYELIAEVTGQPMQWVVPRGTVP